LQDFIHDGLRRSSGDEERYVRVVAWEEPGTTALIVDVAEADALVGHFRRALTPSGREGMPPHITVLAPFTPASLLTDSRVRELRTLLAAFPRFDFMLTRLKRFETGTLYLAPEPEQPFIAMSQALLDAFPELSYPPAGATRIIPHLTVATAAHGVEQVEAAARQIERELPLAAAAREVLLMERDHSRRWRTSAVIELQ
jgi:2'-5' RNA ligase